MPAVTVPNITVLPRLSSDITRLPRPVLQRTHAPHGFEGEGFPVRRAFAGIDLAHLDPFLHMDQIGEIEYAPGEPKGTPWHPHRGFETVTYMMDGSFQHQDSIGGGGLITNGDTQWMTAGAGILHIERPPEELFITGGLFHGIQLWVNLPSAKKWSPPRYQDIRASQVLLLGSHDGASLVRVIAGKIDGFHGPGVTHTPIALAHVSVPQGSRISIPWNPTFNALVYVLHGNGWAGSSDVPITTGDCVVFGPGDTIDCGASEHQESRSPELNVLVLGGAPIGEPIAFAGPFVMNSHAELAQAFADFREGRIGTIPAGALRSTQEDHHSDTTGHPESG